MTLFTKEAVVGSFRGFSGGGLEFHADLVLPYRSDFQTIPMHGQFVIAALEDDNEAVLGRITTLSAEGRLVSPTGEDYAVRAVREERPIPEELRDQYLKYKVDIRVLGVLRKQMEDIVFVPSHRRLPHVGAKVAFLGEDLLREVASATSTGDGEDTQAEIGFLSFGEFIYAKGDDRLKREPWMAVTGPPIVPRFPVNQLVSRRTFVFARAGFGKSNLIKLLFARLYSGKPTVEKREQRRVPVGTVIVDPDGEYFWPDDRGRPALCDVPELRDNLVVFTNRQNRSDCYQSFVVGGVKLDIRQLPAARVLGIALAPEKQDQQNVAKLKNLPAAKWATLVDAVASGKGGTSPEVFYDLLDLKTDGTQDAEMLAARSNMVRVVTALHDPSSVLLGALKEALASGKLCVVDISQMRGSQGLSLAGILLQHLFDHNQDEFTKADATTIPTIAVIEEAQTVLGGSLSDESPFVAWVKEGRKYDLGAVLVTQQPASLAAELLSQGDNWFVFHLLSSGDLGALERANAHFSDDVLASLLNEPIVGHGVFWSSAGSKPKPYPVPIRALSFNDMYARLDPEYSLPGLNHYASQLRERYRRAISEALSEVAGLEGVDVGEVDAAGALRLAAIRRLEADAEAMGELTATEGIRWGRFQSLLAKCAPNALPEEPFKWAYNVVPQALDLIVGPSNYKFDRRLKEDGSGSSQVWIVVRRREDGTSGVRASVPHAATVPPDDDVLV